MKAPDNLEGGASCWYHYCDRNAAFTPRMWRKCLDMQLARLARMLPRKRSVPIATDVLAGAGTDKLRQLQITSSKGHRPRFGIWSLGFLWSLVFGAVCFLIGGCSFAPKYQRPAVQIPAAFKELTPQSSDATNLWKRAKP